MTRASLNTRDVSFQIFVWFQISLISTHLTIVDFNMGIMFHAILLEIQSFGGGSDFFIEPDLYPWNEFIYIVYDFPFM